MDSLSSSDKSWILNKISEFREVNPSTNAICGENILINSIIFIDNGTAFNLINGNNGGLPLYISLNNGSKGMGIKAEEAENYFNLLISYIDKKSSQGSSNDLFSNGETPIGLIDGNNTIFTLLFSPIGNSLIVYLNGVRLSSSYDYSIAGNTLTMINVPFSSDKLRCDYRY